MQSFDMPSFVCGINNGFFFGGGRKPLKGGKNVRWNNVVTSSKQHESAVTRGMQIGAAIRAF